ncbi:MAG TPA: phospho-N-acetylmuramoyl-pentapeptide-transferase [Candidatus Saccharimonadales bacterium]
MLTSEQFIQKVTIVLLLSFLSFCIALLLTPIYTYFAYKYKLWKRHRTHSTTGEALKVISKLRIKRNVPLMAGLVTMAAVTAVTVGWNLSRSQTWLPLAGFIGGGIVGLIDDIINIKGSGGKFAGLRPQVKFGMIAAVAIVGALFFYYKLDVTTIHIPFAGNIGIGWGIIPLFALVVVSTGNAVNISDGMDGLAGGLLLSSYGAYAIIALLEGSYGIAAFCMTIVGALLAYLWFNIPPARFFMGDVGSFSLGTALGIVAMQTDTIFLLPLIGFVFVAEAGSTLLQVLSKRIFHRRIFIAAPIHHHFEALGWPKTKVTMRFWVIGEVCASLGVIIALIGGYIS